MVMPLSLVGYLDIIDVSSSLQLVQAPHFLLSTYSVLRICTVLLVTQYPYMNPIFG